MKVLRKQELETSSIQVGDQIVIQLTGFGEFTATAQKITNKGTLFLFDDCVAKRPMNGKWTNKGGYEKSDLCKWISDVLSAAFPEDLINRIDNLTIPIMVKRKNRIADFDNDYEWYWLQNATKKEVSSSYFALVTYRGTATYYSASYSYGVRPVFWLVN